MQFKISKISFNNALSLVSRALAVNSPLPALSGIKVVVSETDVTLIASDGDLSIQKILQVSDEKNTLTIDEPGEIVLEGRYLIDIVRKMDSDIVSFELRDGSLIRISGNLAQFNLNGMRASNYPRIDFSTPEMTFQMSAEDLGEIISQTLFATSDKETRPVLTGMNFVYDLEKLVVVATDSYRLARKIIPLSSVDKPFNVTIPRKVLGEITKILGEEDMMTIAISDQKIQFINDHNLLQSRLLEGVYPETNRLVPTSYQTELRIASRDLLNALDRASFIKSDGLSIVSLMMSAEKVEMSSKSQEIGSSLEMLNPVAFTGESLNLSFSAKYVSEAIRALNVSEIVVKFSGEMRPFVLENPNDDSVVQLVLPVRTYD